MCWNGSTLATRLYLSRYASHAHSTCLKTVIKKFKTDLSRNEEGVCH